MEERFKKAANALAAGRKVSVPVKELPQGNVGAWLQELRYWLQVYHTDPCSELRFKVYVTCYQGVAVAAAKVVFID